MTKEITSYHWSNGEMGTSITVNPIESTTYTVTVTDCSGCSSVEEYDVIVACLMADLGPDRMINLGETVELSPVISGNSICSDHKIQCDPEQYKISLVKWCYYIKYYSYTIQFDIL